ncbi:hypothetical protein RI054_12g63610 [Pseudoscourfieldia marina]
MAILFACHVPRKSRPIVLKTVAIIYNNMTHGATDKIPSIALSLRPTISRAPHYRQPHLRVHTGSATQCGRMGVTSIWVSKTRSAYVYDPPHRFARRFVEGGGDGLDEVDKFIHDALNQAPPTEGGASPIEGGGEPDLGALGIHGHSEQMVNDRVYKRITRITGDHTYEAYNPFQQEKRYTVTQMASHAARRDGMSRFTDSADPHMTDLPPSSAGTLV